jgi:FAD/FMN-containing dehydrogenase
MYVSTMLFIALAGFTFLPCFASSPASTHQWSQDTTKSGACALLQADLPGKVFYIGSPQYTNSSSSYFTSFENELQPACIARPSNSKDIATIVKTIGFTSHVKLAIRGGGHTTWPGAANVDFGVTIDMQGINGVLYENKTKIVKIGAGEIWQNVYATLGSHGVAVTGGRVSKVGVAGLTMGGKCTC